MFDVRLVAGTERADGKEGTPDKRGTLRIDSVVLTGSPVIADDICGYVKADPASGEAATGTEITLTSATEGAAIYYSIDGPFSSSKIWMMASSSEKDNVLNADLTT